MTRPFEPADVIAAYERHGLRPVDGKFYVDSSSGEIRVERNEGCCCALTAVMVGHPNPGPYSQSLINLAAERWPEFCPWAFVHGFDASPRHPPAHDKYYLNQDHYDASYELGIECRRAVRARFPGALSTRPSVDSP